MEWRVNRVEHRTGMRFQPTACRFPHPSDFGFPFVWFVVERNCPGLEVSLAQLFFRRQPAMNIPFPPMSCGQIVSELPAANARPFDFNSGNAIGSNSG